MYVCIDAYSLYLRVYDYVFMYLSAEAPRPWYMTSFGAPITFTSVACRRPWKKKPRGNQAKPPVQDQLTNNGVKNKDPTLQKRFKQMEHERIHETTLPLREFLSFVILIIRFLCFDI